MRFDILLGILALAFMPMPVSAKTPCDGVDRHLLHGEKQKLMPPVARQIGAPHPTILQEFKFEDWSIVYADTGVSDETFIFYHGDPTRTHYVTIWSGAAGLDEESQIREWTVENAPGIPLRLAKCFAWHVTKDRDL